MNLSSSGNLKIVGKTSMLVMNEWKSYVVSELEKANLLKVEDGNHGEYRPQPNEFVREGVAFIRSADIEHGEILFQSASRINETAVKRIRKGIGKAGDTLFTSKGTVGKFALASWDCEPFICSPQVTFWRSLKHNFLDYRFLYYYIQSPAFLCQVSSRSRETDMAPYISLTNQREFKISTPEIKEQKSIADVLSCLDAKIENLRRQNETLEAIAQTLFKHWFIDFEFPNADGKPYKSSGGAMITSELGEIPEGWHVGKLEKFCTVFRGSSPRPISSPVFFENGNIPWIKIADATRSNSIYLSETREHCTEAALPHTRLLKKGSLILSNSATVGVPMILNLEGCIHDGWLSFKDYKVITRNLLFFILVNKLNFLMQYADGSVQKNLNTGILNNMDFILPNLEFITKFTAFSQSIFDKILSNENQIQTLTKTRDALLPKLMSGKLRVKE